MTTFPHLPESDQPAQTYEVGFGRPPVHTRVKPGQILNPRGRPKGQRNVSTVLRKALNERIKIKEGNRTRSVTKLDALILKMINDAHSNPKVQANLIVLMRAVGLIEAPDSSPDHQPPFTPNDSDLIADFGARYHNMWKHMKEPPPLDIEAGKTEGAPT